MDSLKKIVQADAKVTPLAVDTSTLPGEFVELDKDVRNPFLESGFI